MLRHVIKQGGVYRGRFRLGKEPKIYDIALGGISKKHVAEEVLKRHVEELENELLGFGKPKAMRDAAALPIGGLLIEYRDELTARGRGAKHASAVFHGIERLCAACGWKRLGDVTAEGFGRWRARQTMSPKTSNEYLAMISAFFTWLERNGRWQANPLKSVVKAETRGKQRRERAPSAMSKSSVWCSPRDGVAWFTWSRPSPVCGAARRRRFCGATWISTARCRAFVSAHPLQRTNVGRLFLCCLLWWWRCGSCANSGAATRPAKFFITWFR